MTLQEEIAALQARIADARAELDAGQATGVPEKYYDATFRLEALERELEGLRQQGLRAFASRDVMDELGITLRDGAYCVGAATYSRLEDAVTYARLRRTQGRRR
jgi:hypothetical protein